MTKKWIVVGVEAEEVNAENMADILEVQHDFPQIVETKFEENELGLWVIYGKVK